MKLLALAIALFLVPQDEKITLKFNPKKGDKLIGTQKMELQLKIKTEIGDKIQEIEFEQRGSTKVVREFAEVADGQVTKMVFDCTESYEEKRQPPAMLEWTRTDDPLHGRKVTISIKDGQVVREGADGLAEKDLRKLDLKSPSSFIFPKQPVAVGDSWEVKGDAIRELLAAGEEIKEGKIKLKLTAVKEIDKRRCAVLSAALEATGKAEGEVEFTVKADLEVVIWIERGYMLSAKGRGKVNLKGENEQMSMTGEGPITIE